MALPPLVYYPQASDYRDHYKNVYCRGVIHTFDNVRVFFSPSKFDHAFYECSARDGKKDTFSNVRAQRIDWIKSTLEQPQASLYQGWNQQSRGFDAARRVAVVYEEFVVVVGMGLKSDGDLKANFITCYQADNSIDKIRTSPTWSRVDCISQLNGGG